MNDQIDTRQQQWTIVLNTIPNGEDYDKIRILVQHLARTECPTPSATLPNMKTAFAMYWDKRCLWCNVLEDAIVCFPSNTHGPRYAHTVNEFVGAIEAWYVFVCLLKKHYLSLLCLLSCCYSPLLLLLLTLHSPTVGSGRSWNDDL